MDDVDDALSISCDTSKATSGSVGGSGLQGGVSSVDMEHTEGCVDVSDSKHDAPDADGAISKSKADDKAESRVSHSWLFSSSFMQDWSCESVVGSYRIPTQPCELDRRYDALKLSSSLLRRHTWAHQPDTQFSAGIRYSDGAKIMMRNPPAASLLNRVFEYDHGRSDHPEGNHPPVSCPYPHPD
jgi:hypothetical protein